MNTNTNRTEKRLVDHDISRMLNQDYSRRKFWDKRLKGMMDTPKADTPVKLQYTNKKGMKVTMHFRSRVLANEGVIALKKMGYEVR